MEIEIPEWAKELDYAITVCNRDGVVLYMNDKAKATFADSGDMIGKSMFGCHNENSMKIIHRLLDEGGKNVYTIDKKGQKKLIYQTGWKKDGKIMGLVEISLVLPAEIPHYIR